jgi:hypothetical protein
MQSIRGHYQREFIGNPALAGDFDRRSRRRKIADSTVDPAAAEFNRAGLQYPVAGVATRFYHRAGSVVLEKPQPASG